VTKFASFLASALALAACGDSSSSPAQPDAPGTPDAPEGQAFTPGCVMRDQTGADMFDAPTDFEGEIMAGSLAGWNPDGRWFLTGTKVGSVSSFHFLKRASDIVVDRDTLRPGTMTDDAIFQRTTFSSQQGTTIVAKRVVNRLADGSLRADRAVCDGTTCRVCTARMVRAEHHDPQVSNKLTLVGQLLGAAWDRNSYTFNVRVAGNTAYLIRQDGLYIINVTDPANPVELGHFKRTGDGYSNDVKIVDTATKRYAIIADFPVDVVDVTNPAAPVLAAQIPEEAHTLATETRAGKTLAYFGNYDGTTPVFDVTNPAAPTRLGRYNANASNVHDLSVKDGIAYLNAWEKGLLVVDFNTPATPALKGSSPSPTNTSHSNWTTTAGGRHIALTGDEAYAAHLDVIDVDPASAQFMKALGTYKTRDHVSIHNIMAFGTKAYFTYYQDGVRVLDVSDPANPKLSGYFNTWDPQADYTSSQFFEGAVGLDVDLARKLIFVADSPRGLLILRDDT
jgi:hypothetical protein